MLVHLSDFVAVFTESLQYNFTKILPLGAEFIHADGQVDRHDKADRCLPQFCECTYLVALNEYSGLYIHSEVHKIYNRVEAFHIKVVGKNRTRIFAH